MKTVAALLILIADMLLSFHCKSQTKVVWYSIPVYDSVGNVTIYKKEFDHIPTKQDTIDFGRRSDFYEEPAAPPAVKPKKKVIKKKY